jgi:hypothetical protein
MNLFNKIINFLNNPMVALLIMLTFLIIYFLAQGLTTGFSNDFLSFGPTNDSTGKPTTFMGIQLNTWKNVILVYFIIFISTVLQIYYSNIITTNLRSYAFNPAVKIIPFSKFWTYFSLLMDPFISIMLFVLRFHAMATLQVQYIIPQILGSVLTSLPFTLKWLHGKQFININIF